jgi:nitroreductase
VELFQVLIRRRACREFKKEPVPKDLVDKLVYAASRAPTASNIPYRHFIVIDNPRVIRSVKQISPSLLADPPLLIVVFTDLRTALEKTGRVAEFSSLVDSGAAGENILLEATELGLGSQFTMISAMEGIRRILRLPNYCRVDLIIPIGYPQKQIISVKPRKGANKVYHNQYGELFE